MVEPLPLRSPDNLIWIDLEFTHLDPTHGQIMQGAMIVTRADLTPLPPPGIPPETGGLLFDVHIDGETAANASEWVRANQQAQIQRSLGPEALPVAKVEELFLAYLLATCEVADDKARRPILCGNSVHGDRNYLARYMPKLVDLLSYRLLDVSGFKELASRWCKDLEFDKNPETIQRWYPANVKVEGAVHDALFDIKGSIAELNFYREHMFVPSARG